MIIAAAFVGVAVVFIALGLIAYALFLAEGGVSRPRPNSAATRRPHIQRLEGSKSAAHFIAEVSAEPDSVVLSRSPRARLV
jgi:hypothetical protein